MSEYAEPPELGSVIDDISEYSWNAESNDHEADLNTYVRENHTTTPNQDKLENTQHTNSVQAELRVTDPDQPRRNSILQESAHETLSRLSNQFPPVIEDGADTLIWLGEPPRQPGQNDYEYGFIRRQFQMPYLMKSETLRKLKSPKFNKFLGPMSARTERRLKKHAIHKLIQSTAHIKYYIDLSPVLNDEEAMAQLTQLTVPSGALFWHQKAQQFSVNTELICGRDDLDIPPKPVYNYRHSSEEMYEPEIETLEKKLDSIAHELKAGEASMGEAKQTHSKSKPKVHPYDLPLEEEYTQLRHHTAIARLLHAVVGNDPKLNSAAKTWTFCMLADYFECASNSSVSHWVISWLLQTGNINFLQTNPDIAYRMAMATRSGWLMKCTFAILVGQQAMSKGMKNLLPIPHVVSTQPKQVMDCLNDDEINRVDHAAEVFSRRMRATFEEIALFPGIWTFSDPTCVELSKLRRLKVAPQGQNNLEHVMDCLKDYVRRVVIMTLSDAYPFDNSTFTPFKASESFSAYGQVPRSLRNLTQFHWEVLRAEELHRDYLDTPNNHLIWKNTLEQLAKDGLLVHADIPYVSKQKLYESIHSLNEQIVSSGGSVWLPGSSGPREKRTGQDRWRAAHESNNPAKRVKTDTTSAKISQAPLDLPIRARDSSVHELMEGHNQTEGFTEDDSDTNSDDWEEVVKPGDNEKAVRFLPVRPKRIVPTPVSVTSTVSDEVEGRPGTSSGIASKLQEMGIGLNALDSKDDSMRVLDQPAQTRTMYPKAPLTGDQQVADHVLSSGSFLSYQRNTEKPTHSPSRIPDPPSSYQLPDETSSGRFTTHTSEPFTWLPKPNVKSPIGKEKTWTNPDAISPEGLLRDLTDILAKKLHPLLTPGYVTDGSLDFDIPVDNINTLLCLSEEEYKYLPLWAYVFVDGSGGVFDVGADVRDAPDVADGGFRGGAMGIIAGVGSSMGGSMAGSEFEDLATEAGISTVGKASRYATDGTATETVVSMDE